VDHFFQVLHQSKNQPFTYQFDYEYKRFREGREPKIRQGAFSVARQSEENFSCTFSYKLFNMYMTRRPGKLFIYLPHSETLFIEESAGFTRETRFSFENIIATSLKMEPGLKNCYDSIMALKGENVEEQLQKLGLSLKRSADIGDSENYEVLENDRVKFSAKINDGKFSQIALHINNSIITLNVTVKKSADIFQIPDKSEIKKRVVIKDFELHRSLVRGFARLAEVKYREAQPPSKENFVRRGPHGLYRMKDGQRIIKLKGDSYEIGWQHGKFLAPEIRRVTDSTLYLVGLIYSIKKSKWFFTEIRSALARLDKFTPKEYLEEMRGVADGSGMDYERVHMANYFPALFHCSGFTLKDSATKDGRMYHGRILDYMCAVGLQYNAVLFAVEKKGKIPFANISFASFIGSVSGMNTKKISLGEMGGKGEGDWDGITMPLLMRMSLENAGTLQQVKDIFSNNPRTCEYYYVFADGKTKESVGVYALPEKIEFIKPGEKHELQKYSVKDCVLMSGGKRYENLVSKTREGFGKFDEQKTIRLMDYPVAMRNHNLHSVLFIPEDLKLWVSNAGRAGSAFASPYYSYKLNEILKDSFYENKKRTVKK